MAHDANTTPILTARKAGLLGCGTCGCVSPAGTPTCPRCGLKLVSRDTGSIGRVWAWWFAGLVFYIPANLYPMLQTRFLGTKVDSTILGGVVDLVHHGSYMIAAVVFLASIVIPVCKFLAVGYLAWSVNRRDRMSLHARTMLYEVVEFIGRWSMIDVFVVAILAALVNLGIVMSFRPGAAAIFFALSVASTMISAQSFDSRLFWDAADTERDDHE
jgi:paraquat-inducible protein A